MAEQKPLHVRVAEALGWTAIHRRARGECPSGGWCGDIMLPGERWAGRAPGNMLVGPDGCHDSVPPYGEDTPEGWACTGPLLERYELALDKCDDERPWLAVDQTEKRYAFGPTPCAAIAEWVAEHVKDGEVTHG